MNIEQASQEEDSNGFRFASNKFEGFLEAAHPCLIKSHASKCEFCCGEVCTLTEQILQGLQLPHQADRPVCESER